MLSNKINFKDKLSKFNKHWSPRIIAEMNDYQFKVAKIKGEFVWHDHKDTDVPHSASAFTQAGNIVLANVRETIKSICRDNVSDLIDANQQVKAAIKG